MQNVFRAFPGCKWKVKRSRTRNRRLSRKLLPWKMTPLSEVKLCLRSLAPGYIADYFSTQTRGCGHSSNVNLSGQEFIKNTNVYGSENMWKIWSFFHTCSDIMTGFVVVKRLVWWYLWVPLNWYWFEWEKS